MSTLYLVFLLVGIILIAAVTLLGEILDPVFDFLWSVFLLEKIAMLSPIPMFAAFSSFGITGYLLTTASDLPSLFIFCIALVLAFLTIVSLYYLIIKPRELSETSLSFSIKKMSGLQGVVSIPIPANGFGEVIVKIGGGVTNQIAASYDNIEIAVDEKIFIVDEKEGVLYVSLLTI